MPTYEYRCEACGHEFELFQSMTDAVKRKCPECKELKLKRLVGSGAGIIFKGSGFYQTDYRSESYTKAAEADKKASTDGKVEKSDSAKSDAASDAPAKKQESSSTSSDKPAKKSSAKKSRKNS
jgi:putative FmdB family regulatory protein